MNKLNRIADDIEEITEGLVKAAIAQTIDDDIMNVSPLDLALMQSFYSLTGLINEYLQEEARVLSEIQDDIAELRKS